jgi:hypothetical protein
MTESRQAEGARPAPPGAVRRRTARASAGFVASRCDAAFAKAGNFRAAKLVVTVVFRARHRRPHFTDPLNWTDYRWDADPWRMGAAKQWGHARGPWGRTRQHGRHPLLLLFVAGIAALIGAKLLSGLQSRNGSWARRGFYAAVLLMIVAAFSRNRRNGW